MSIKEPLTRNIKELLSKAAKCRRLARACSDAQASEALLKLADEIEEEIKDDEARRHKSLH